MDIRYANNKVEKQCTDLKAATKLFGGDKNMAISLMSRINAIEQATVLKRYNCNADIPLSSIEGQAKRLFCY